MIVWGNSFAQKAFYSIDQAFRKRYREIRLLGSEECLPFLQYGTQDECKNVSEDTVKLVEKVKPDLLFIAFK